MGPVGWQEMTFIFVLALVLFGPKEMARIGRTIGKAIADFRRTSSELKATFDRELSSLERESQPAHGAGKPGTEPLNYGYHDNYGYDSYNDPASTPVPEEIAAPERAEPAAIAPPETATPASGDAAEPPGGPQPIAS